MSACLISYKTVYTFAELCEREGDGIIRHGAADRVRERYAEMLSSDEWWYECAIDTWKEALAQIGFSDPKIFFSVGWGQGHGACVESASLDFSLLLPFLVDSIAPEDCIKGLEKGEDFRSWILFRAGRRSAAPYAGETLARKLRRLIPFASDCLSGHVDASSRGLHSTATVCFNDGWARGVIDRVVTLAETDLAETLNELLVDLGWAIHASIESEWDYAISDEQIREQGLHYSADGSPE